MRVAINALVIRNGHILLAKKRNTWILPGGKPEKDESDIECLLREVTKEEIPGTELTNIRFYENFEGMAPYRGDIIQVKVYFADIQGEIKPGAEIVDVRWVKDFNNLNLSDITKQIIESLKNNGHL